MLQKINETNESYCSYQNLGETASNKEVQSQLQLKSGSDSTMVHSQNPKQKAEKASSMQKHSSYMTSKNYTPSKNEIALDNNFNIVLEDYEDGESITWYRQQDNDEVSGNEIIQKDDISTNNYSPQTSKLYHDTFASQQKYLIKDLESGQVLDIRKRNSIIPRSTNMESCWSKWWEQKKEINNNFLKACSLNYFQKIQELLNIKEKDLNPLINQLDSNGQSPLHYASQYGNQQMANILLAHDADIEMENSLNQTPLITCCFYDHINLALLLISCGSDINAQDVKYNTPLHYAFMNGNKLLIEALMRKPSLNIDIKNLENKLPFELCSDDNLIRLYQELKLKKKQLQKEINKVKIINITKEQINKTFISGKQQIFQKNTQQKPEKDIKLLSFESEDKYNSFQYQEKVISKKQSQQDLNISIKESQSGLKNQQHSQQTDSIQKQSLNSLKEQKIRSDMFKVIGQIGQGSFGEVFLVQHKDNNQKFALKMLRKSDLLKQQMMKYAFTERNVLSQSECPFVAKLHYAFQTQDKLFLVMDYGHYGDLGTHLQIERRFSEEKAKFYTAQILLAIEHLHFRNVIYRDLKSDNIVVCNDGYIKLTDFGLAKENVPEFSHGAQSFCGSVAYMPPEMLKSSSTHGKSIDLYLFGVLLYELLTGTPPFYSSDKETLYHNIQFSAVKFPTYVSKSAKNLIQKLLQKDPRFRPTYEEVRRHTFYKGLDWQKLEKKELQTPVPTITKERVKRVYTDIYEVEDDFNPNYKPKHLQSWTFINNNHIFTQEKQYNQIQENKQSIKENQSSNRNLNFLQLNDHQTFEQ